MSFNVIDESHQSDIHLISLWSNRCGHWRVFSSLLFSLLSVRWKFTNRSIVLDCRRVFRSLSLKFTRMCLVANYSFYLIPHSVSKMVGKCHDSSQWPCLVQYTMSVFNIICVDVDRVICYIHEGILSVFKLYIQWKHRKERLTFMIRFFIVVSCHFFLFLSFLLSCCSFRGKLNVIFLSLFPSHIYNYWL